MSLAAFHAAGDTRAYPEAGPAWPAAKLDAIAQIDAGQWETLRPAFQAAGFDVGGHPRSRQRARGPGPEAATVALDVRPYSAIQRQALLAHRTQIPPDSLWRRLWYRGVRRYGLRLAHVRDVVSSFPSPKR